MAGSDAKARAPVVSRGYLVIGDKAGQFTAETIDLATFLRERVHIPIVLSDLEFQAAIEHARALGLSHLVTIGRTIELWNLEQGDVHSVREGELIEQMRTRYAVFRGDRS
jgi:histidyl-tRNA synthetase